MSSTTLHSQATQNKVFQNPIIISSRLLFLILWCPPFICLLFSFTCTSMLTLNSMKGKHIHSLYKLFSIDVKSFQGAVIWLLWSWTFVTKGWDAWTCHDALRLKFPNMGWRLLSHWLGDPKPSWCHHNGCLKRDLIVGLIALKKTMYIHIYIYLSASSLQAWSSKHISDHLPLNVQCTHHGNLPR